MRLSKVLMIFTLLAFSFTAMAQKIRIIDQDTGEPVERVALYTPSFNKSVITGADGYASLDGFMKNDTIIFQHPSYHKVFLTKKQILASGGTVYLQPRVVMLDESVVSISRWEQNKREVPNHMVTIPRDRIGFFNPQTAADLLNIYDQVFIQKSQLGGGSPMLRGFAANAVLLVIDGTRMNNAIYRSGNLQNVISLDPHVMEASEVIFGPGTVIYGSDALGGVMDFHTLVPALSTKDKPLMKTHALVRVASANREKTIHADLSSGWEKWSFLASFSSSGFEDLRMGKHSHPELLRTEYVIRNGDRDTVIPNPDPDIQVPSGYHQINLLGKMRFRPGENTDYLFSVQYSRLSNVPRYDRLIQHKNNHPKYADWHYGPQKWMMPHLTVDLKKKTLFYDNSKINLAYQYYEESRHDRKLNSVFLRHRTEKVHIANLNADFDKVLTDNVSFLFYGLEFNFNDIHSTGVTEDIITRATFSSPSRYPDGLNHYYAAAGYASYKNNFSALFTFNGGIRINYVALHCEIGDTSFYHFPYQTIDLANSALTGSAGLVYHPGNRWQFKINFSTGFRAPNLDDVGKIFDSEPGRVIVPNPGLKPEYLYNLDANVIRKNGKVFSFDFSVFASYLHHAMVRRPFSFNGHDSIMYDGELSEVQALTNTGHAFIFGSSFTVTFDLPFSLQLRSSLTFNRGKDQAGYPLRHVPPLFGATHLCYEKAGFTADIFFRYNGKIPYQRLALSERNKDYMYAKDAEGKPWSPAWYTMNLATAYRFHNGLSLHFDIGNILDVRYRPYASGIAGPGRDFVLAIRYTI
ncbi:MAG: TonB-dependent receptor [Bacteroidales bacterium]|nr:TonB-dependent receptor [Bacteroidales bacterium]